MGTGSSGTWIHSVVIGTVVVVVVGGGSVVVGGVVGGVVVMAVVVGGWVDVGGGGRCVVMTGGGGGGVRHPHVAGIFGLGPSQFAIRHRVVIDHQHVAGSEFGGVARSGSGGEQADGRARAQVPFFTAGSQHQSAGGGRERRLR